MVIGITLLEAASVGLESDPLGIEPKRDQNNEAEASKRICHPTFNSEKCNAKHGICQDPNIVCLGKTTSGCGASCTCCLRKETPKCKKSNKCSKKGGVCQNKDDECLGKATVKDCEDEGCACCVPPKCKKSDKCSKKGGVCQNKDDECLGTATMKDCEGESCACCVAKWREDLRCGEGTTPADEEFSFKLPNGEIAECDPKGGEPCCSSWAYCGNGPEWCECPTCQDFREPTKPDNKCKKSDKCEQKGGICQSKTDKCDGTFVKGCEGDDCACCITKWRGDLRCGQGNTPTGEYFSFTLPNGQVAECDPDSEKPCCSSWGYCGNGAEWCECPTCIDYRKENADEVVDEIIDNEGENPTAAETTQ